MSNLRQFLITEQLKNEVFDSGTGGIWTAPSTVSVVFITACGGGGGGGSGGTNSGSTTAAGGGNGGNAGCVCFRIPVEVTGGTGYTITLGDGGSGGTAQTGSGAGNDGSPGNPTIFKITSGADLLRIEGGGGGLGGGASAAADEPSATSQDTGLFSADLLGGWGLGNLSQDFDGADGSNGLGFVGGGQGLGAVYKRGGGGGAAGFKGNGADGGRGYDNSSNGVAGSNATDYTGAGGGGGGAALAFTYDSGAGGAGGYGWLMLEWAE
jgi:hypothetical protein